MRAALLFFVLAVTTPGQSTGDLETTVLPRRATAELESGDFEAARRDAQRLLQLAAENSKEWNRDDLLHAAYTLLGRLALDRGDLNEAKAQLLASGRVKGSAALESFGPDMKLAQELLAAGERDVVLQYLDLCRGFWKYDRGRIDRLVSLIKAEADPDLFLGAKAPGFKLRDLSGRVWTLAELSGRPVALHFWATWCRLCREELQSIEKPSDDSVILAVDVGEDEATVRRFVDNNHVAVPVLLAEDDAMVLSYKVASYPTAVAIDRQGQVTGYRVGTASVGQFEQGAK